MNTVIEIQDKKYEINIDKAIELGLAKEKREEIVNIFSGDVYSLLDVCFGCMIIVAVDSCKFHMIGYNHQLLPFSGVPSGSEIEILKYLNKNGYVYRGNINQDVKLAVGKLLNN